jgi:hypothetical protein
MTQDSGITKVFGPLSVDHVIEDKYKTGVLSAQIRQTVNTTYPSMKVKPGGLFDLADFNLPAGQNYSSTRVAWVHVPAGTSVEQVAERIAANPGSRIYRLISNNVLDVMTADQKSAMVRAVENCTQADFEDRLRVRDANGDDLPGAPIYSQNFFSTVTVEDGDNRTTTGVDATIGTTGKEDAFAVVADGVALQSI